MKAIYSIRTCRDEEAKRIEIELPDGCTDPYREDAEFEALLCAGYAALPPCSHCGRIAYHARYVGCPMTPIPGAIVSIEGKNRVHLIATLGALMSHLQVAPDYASLVVCDEDGGYIA